MQVMFALFKTQNLSSGISCPAVDKMKRCKMRHYFGQSVELTN